MKEVVLTSSVMILAVMGLRVLFRGRVRHGLIYGAWLLVAVRLLVPVQFGSFDFSLLNRAEPVTEVIGQIAETPVSGQSQKEIRQEVELDYFVRGEDLMPQIQQILEQEKLRNPDMEIESVYEQIMEERPREEVFTPEAQTKIEQTVQQRFTAPTLGELAVSLWIAGMVGMAVWFGWVNLSLARKLRRSGRLYSVEGKTPVWVSNAVPSPCLFGIFRPKIWLTPGCVENEMRLRHVLAHEMTHRRHWDHIWSLVRCLCLCVYWFNPLVWAAAWLSKRDCELACDEAALKLLGDDQRIAYGKTLVDMVAENVAPGQLLETATAMHETKKQLKARVGYIVTKPKVLVTAVVVLVLTLAIVTGCTFGGQKETEPNLNVPETTAPTESAQPTEATKPTEATRPTELPTQPAEQTEPLPTEPEPTKPEDPQTELAQLGALFLDPESIYHRLLGYMHKARIKDLFYDGFPEESRQPTTEEWQHLKSIDGFREGLQLIRLPVEKVDAVLKKYLGTYCAQLMPYQFEGLTYLESTNCLYYMTDTVVRPQVLQNLQAVDFGKTKNGLYFMTYTVDGSYGEQRIYVRPHEDDYIVLGSRALANLNANSETYLLPLSERAQARTVLDPSEYRTTVCAVGRIAEGIYGLTNTVSRIRSVEELERYMAPSSYQYYDYTFKDPSGMDSFLELTAKCDAKYFEQNALLVVRCICQKGQFPVISRIDFGNNDGLADVLVYVDNTNPNPAELQIYTVIIELPKVYVDYDATSDHRSLYAVYGHNGGYLFFDEIIVLDGELLSPLEGKAIRVENYSFEICNIRNEANQGPGSHPGDMEIIPSMEYLEMYKEHLLDRNEIKNGFGYDTRTDLCPVTFREAISGYEETYFDDKILVLAFVESTLDSVPVIYDVLIVNGELRIYYDLGDGAVIPDSQGGKMYTHYPLLLEIPVEYKQYINRGYAYDIDS